MCKAIWFLCNKCKTSFGWIWRVKHRKHNDSKYWWRCRSAPSCASGCAQSIRRRRSSDDPAWSCRATSESNKPWRSHSSSIRSLRRIWAWATIARTNTQTVSFWLRLYAMSSINKRHFGLVTNSLYVGSSDVLLLALAICRLQHATLVILRILANQIVNP